MLMEKMISALQSPRLRVCRKRLVEKGNRGKEKVPINRNLGSPSKKVLLVLFYDRRLLLLMWNRIQKIVLCFFLDGSCNYAILPTRCPTHGRALLLSVMPISMSVACPKPWARKRWSSSSHSMDASSPPASLWIRSQVTQEQGFYSTLVPVLRDECQGI